MQRKKHIYTLEVWESEEMSPHIPKLIPTLGIGVFMESQIFRKQF
jgi:hypothetical protein